MVTRLKFQPLDGKALACRRGEERGEYFEPESGLRLRVTAKGSRSWVIVYWSPVVKGQSRKFRLGDAAKMPLKEARKQARFYLAQVETERRDPFMERRERTEREHLEKKLKAEERRRVAEERAHSTTFGEICRKYIEERRTSAGGRTKRKASNRTTSINESILKLYVDPTIGNRLPQTLTREDIIILLKKAQKRGESMPRNVRGFLSAVWRWMEMQPRELKVRLPRESPLIGIPEIGAGRGQRDRVLNPREIWKLWRATEEVGLAGLALRYILLTGCRVREATHLPWSEIDFQAKIWTLPRERNKSARARQIPLSKQALAVLDKVDRKGELVFGGVQLNEPMKAIRTAMGVFDWQPRDLRHTAGTMCLPLGADAFVVSLVLGHSHEDKRAPAITRTYMHWRFKEQARKALDSLGNWIEETVSSEREPGEVVQIDSARA